MCLVDMHLAITDNPRKQLVFPNGLRIAISFRERSIVLREGGTVRVKLPTNLHIGQHYILARERKRQMKNQEIH